MDRARSWWPFPLLSMSPIWYSIQIRYFIRNFICFTYRFTLLYPCLQAHCSCLELTVPWVPVTAFSTLGSWQTCALVGHVWFNTVPVGFGWPVGLPDVLRLHVHGTGTEIRYQDPSALPWSKMATATAGKDVYTAISTLSHCVSRVWRRV